MSQGGELIVLSVNCQGLQDKQKQFDVIDYFSKTKAGIICLQDTQWTPKDESKIRSIWNGDCILNAESTNSRGVAILLAMKFEYSITAVYKDDEGNMISLDLKLGDISLKLLNIYAPDKG